MIQDWGRKKHEQREGDGVAPYPPWSRLSGDIPCPGIVITSLTLGL